MFQSWGSMVANAFNTAGWVKITGVGEIDWTTASSNASPTTSWGFEIWRMNDALQSTAPVYIRLDYGSGASAVTPRIWTQFGSGYSGNALMGPITTNLASSTQSASAGGLWTSYFSGANNRMQMSLFTASANNLVYSIERTHDANGNDTDEGILFASSNTSTAHMQTYWNRSLGTTGTEIGVGAFLPSIGSGATGTTTTMYPLYFASGRYSNPALGLLIAYAATVTSYSAINLTFFGTSHTYLPIPQGMTNRSSVTVGQLSTLMRWE